MARFWRLLAPIVSIHASVKDATVQLAFFEHQSNVSIHASVKDATKISIGIILPISFNPRICKRCDQDLFFCHHISFCFNPRICKRCDYKSDVELVKGRVSIHASVKDATMPT